MKKIAVGLAVLWCCISTAKADLPPTPWVDVRLQALDLSNNPITSVTVGQDFRLAVFAQDIRSPADPFPGVFSVGLHVTYDPSLASISPTATLQGGSRFSVIPTQTDLSTPGLITTEVISLSLTANGTGPLLLFRVPVHATNVGLETFTPTYESTLPLYQVLVFDPLFFAGDPRAAGLLPGDIEFDPLSLVVVPEPSTLVLVALGGAALIGWSMSAPRKLRSLDG